jgi:hypothetical protein
VAYGISRSPLGPIDIPPDNVILQKRGRVVGTGHNSVIRIPGSDRWYIFYHRHAVPHGSGYLRETCLAPMIFGPDGRIENIDPLMAAFPEGSESDAGVGIPQVVGTVARVPDSRAP